MPAPGVHVLFLAVELPSLGSNILHQIRELENSGHTVSLIAIVDDNQLDQELEISEKRDFWTHIRNRKRDPLPDCPGASNQLYKTLHEYVRLYDRSGEDRAYLKKAMRLQRTLLSFHWSRKVRRERRKMHRDFRARMKDMVTRDDKARHARRFTTVSWYEVGVCGYVDESTEFAQRIAEVGEPNVIQVCEAFALTSGVLLARRWGAKLIYDAYKHEPERVSSVPNPFISYFKLFKGDEIVSHGLHDHDIERDDQLSGSRTHDE